MKLSLETSSHKPLEFSHQLPGHFPGPRLPGGEVLFAAGKFGELCIQEFDGDNFLIRYSVLDTEEPFQLDAVNHFTGVHALVMMRNEINPVFDHHPGMPISEGQFTILMEKELDIKIEFAGRQQYIGFEAMLSHSLAESIFSNFPELSNVVNPLSNGQPLILVNPAAWADEEVRDHIRYIFTYSDPEKWRRNYFKNRVWDIVWKLVALHLNNDPSRLDLRRSDREKVYEVQRKIVDNLQEHILIKDLASGVFTNESHLKNIFSKVYGMGIHEYRIYERLKKAMQLIQEGMTVKEAARYTGWQPADLIKAYFKVYGTTPGTIKKKKK
jgi:AraC-like DNA-binding protein